MRKLNPILMAMTFALGACGKGEPASTPVDPQALTVPATPEAAAKTAPPEPTLADNAAKAGDEHAGCAMEAGAEDCPFHDEEAGEGCGHDMAATETHKVEGGTHFGGAFAIGDAKPLGAVLAGATDGQELTVRVSGKIDKVCQKMGCWMVVKDGDVEARVIMKDHAFTVPKDSMGKPTEVEGVLKVRVYSEAQAKHLAEDGGEDPNKVTGEKKELLLTATAVDIGG